ncbi:DUF1724 domain-containing protein, partial [Candidatus Bathyarchaeota archaeon]|nr:DUF1724 domain-containing protein [Candidatus Bathyarchaeota archaeon]
MSFQDYLYDLLFEMASQERHNILLILRDESANLTYLSNKSGLNLPETRRHVTRLMDVDLVERNPDGKYSLTYFGLRILELVEEFSFFTQHKEYFLTHSIDYIPREFRLRLRDLSKSEFHDNILIFIRAIDQVIRYAEKEIWLLVDQFPLNHLSIILEAVERGIRFKIIEPQNRFINPDLEALAPRESLALDKMRYTPLVEQRMFEDVNLLMIMSEKECVIAFPTIEGEFDYRGFRSSDKTFLAWCRELFQYYWDNASDRTPKQKVREPVNGSILGEERSNNFVIIVGQERPE